MGLWTGDLHQALAAKASSTKPIMRLPASGCNCYWLPLRCCQNQSGMYTDVEVLVSCRHDAMMPIYLTSQADAPSKQHIAFLNRHSRLTI